MFDFVKWYDIVLVLVGLGVLFIWFCWLTNGKPRKDKNEKKKK